MEQNPPDRRCQHCGTALTDETTGGLCPRCLLEMNFASRTMPGGEPSPQIPPPTPEEMAARFPQFEILECLGRGGMGIVYKARQKTLDRLVAIKVLAGERHDDPLFETRFEKEARTLAKLSHPNIVTVHDFGESEGMFYLVMEFVDGVNLRDVLRDGRMEPAQALAIVPEICAALQFAHDHGVVHRDIKPENILIDRDGRVKIADFGIAALVGSDADHSGTPPYMAPEQETVGGTIDHRADIYALGVVLYEMLTGERPEQNPSKPSHRVEIDVRLDEIVLRALEKEPARRYQTAGEFRTVVETMAITSPVRSPKSEDRGQRSEVGGQKPATGAGSPAPLKPEATPSPFRRFWWLFLVMPPVCLLLGLIAGVLWGFLTPMQYEATTVIQIRTQATGSDHANEMALSPADSEWITRLNATVVLDRVVGQLDLARSWSVDNAEARQELVTLATFPAIPGTNLRELRIRHTDASQAAAIANAWAQALKAWCAEKDTGETISVVEEATTPERSFGEFSPRVIFGSAIAGLLFSPLIAILLIQTIHRGGRWLFRMVAIAAGSIAVLALLAFSMVSLLRKLAVKDASSDAARPPVSIAAPEISPEQTARSFMVAIRDGNMDAAMGWMDTTSNTWFDPNFQPEKKSGDRLRDSLQHLSDELREEAYAGELDRLLDFTKWVPEKRDETTRFLAVGIAAPSRWYEGGPEHALYLILSSTPDGWRVAHVGQATDTKSLAESMEQYLAIINGELPMTPPRTSQNGSSGSPEQAAGSFMEAIRDGDMDAAMRWVSPEMKQQEKFPLHLELTSKILKDEIYAGQLERLTRFAESEFTNVDGTTMLFAARVTPPTGAQAQEARLGPVLILSSTPEGWRVAHFQEGMAGKSLSEHVKEFLRNQPGKYTKNAIIGKWLAADEKTRIEFFPDGTMSVFDGSMTVGGHYVFLDDGRVKTVINVSGASAVEIIQISVNGDVMTTIDERGNKQEMKRVRMDDAGATPPETGKLTPEAKRLPAIKSPPEGAEFRRFVLDLPVQPPLAMPKDAPLTIEQVKDVLKGVTWGELLAALAEDGKHDGIAVSEIPSPGEKGSCYEITFRYGNGRMLMELAVDWKFRSAEPSRMRPVEMPDKILTESSDFLPQLVVRYAMMSDHAAAAPAVEEAKAQARHARNRGALQQYAIALMTYQFGVGSFPPDLATLLDGDFPGKKRWEHLQKAGLMHNHQTGEMEPPIYHGHKDLREKDHDVTKFILIAAPSADSQGKRLVGFLDTSVKIIDEADYRKQVRKQAEEAKAPGLADQATASNTGAANTQLQELTGILKRAAKALAPYQLELDGATGSMLLRGDVLKDIPDGTRIRVRGYLKTQIHDNSNDPTPAMPMQWHVYMDVREYQRIDNRFDKDPEKRPVAGPIPATTISATPDGMWLDDRKVSHEELAHALKHLQPDTKILIQADPSLRHKEMTAIMETCRKAGLTRIAVASKTNPEKEPPDQ